MSRHKSIILLVLFYLTGILNQCGSAEAKQRTGRQDVCNEDNIRQALHTLESSKLEIYDHIDSPHFDTMMRDYGLALQMFKSIIDRLVSHCPQTNHSHLLDYLKRHLEMEECAEGILQNDTDTIYTKCVLLQDQGNVNCMVNKVVNGTEGFERVLNYCMSTPASLTHKILVYNALSQEAQAGSENYKKLYYHVKKHFTDGTPLTAEETSALGEVMKNIIWSAFKNDPPTAYTELITDIYKLNGTLGPNIAKYLVVEAVNKRVDIPLIQILIDWIPSTSCKVRALLYVYGHISDYPHPNDTKFRLAFPMYAIQHTPNFTEEVDPQLRASLAAAYDTLPDFAKQFMSTGEVCFNAARMENSSIEPKSEDVFLKIHAGFRGKTTNEYLFIQSEEGNTTRCDNSALSSYFFETEVPPEDVSLFNNTKHTKGDFELAGENGVDCDKPFQERNVYVCCSVDYLLTNFKYFEGIFLKFTRAQITHHAEKFRNTCSGRN